MVRAAVAVTLAEAKGQENHKDMGSDIAESLEPKPIVAYLWKLLIL